MKRFDLKLTSWLEGSKLHITQGFYETEVVKRDIWHKIIDFEEKSVKEALIKLGWIPPPQPNN